MARQKRRGLDASDAQIKLIRQREIQKLKNKKKQQTKEAKAQRVAKKTGLKKANKDSKQYYNSGKFK